MDIKEKPPAVTKQQTDSMIDYFLDDRLAGGVIGTETMAGMARKGIDKEGVIGIDNGALRIQPLIKPGWGRSGIAYGPYKRQAGLSFGVFLTNGHNTSEAGPHPDELRIRLQRWALGSETETPLKRIIRWVRSRQRRFMWRRMLQWIRHGTMILKVSSIRENLAIGFFPSEVPMSPLCEGNSFIIHALTAECGEIWASTGSTFQRTVRGLQNVQMYYFVVLRERGAAYYATSIPHVPNLNPYPRMRLLALDAENADERVYAGIHQSVLGEIGFRVDTRVYRTQVVTLPGFDKWYGSAHGADTLTGDGQLHSSVAAVGGNWTVYEGAFERSDQGLIAMDTTNSAMLFLKAPVGFFHVLIKTTDKPVQGIALIWRAINENNYWSLELGSRQCQLSIKEKGIWFRFPATIEQFLAPNALNSLQVSDDGERIRLYINGELVYGTTFFDTRMQDGLGIGIRVTGNGIGAVLRSIEAHPRDIPIPEAFDLGKPQLLEGNVVAVKDHFDGQPADLAGRTTNVGARTWRKEIGKGFIQLTGGGAAKVLATVEKPCPGRTAYTIEWTNPGFADVEVMITPPGIRKGMQEKGRGGLIFWQDPRNYITMSLFHGEYPAVSIAAFFHVDGFEELYDAVWTNVGRRIYWGMPYDFRVVFDGKRFYAFINGEPVLYRALADVYSDWDHMQINRVGILANWEWGTDTGSLFQNFIAKDRV